MHEAFTDFLRGRRSRRRAPIGSAHRARITDRPRQTIYVLDRVDVWRRIQSDGEVSAGSSYWIILLVFGGLMLVFHLRFAREKTRGDE